MRSFSKKLAFVLAAAMVVTAFAPAAKAEAAKEMAINKSSQILYVNEGINHKGGEVAAPGKGNVSVYDFSVKNKPADWKTAYSFAWSSSDEDVVSVAKGGVATAVGVGKATVYCKVTEKATKEVTTLKTKVTVKANADKVEISNADKWDGATVEVGGVVDLNRTMYDENGNKATSRTKGCVTDYTKWVAEPAAGVEIDQKTGKFTFTEDAVAGEYKLSCYTYQSSKYTEKTAESDVVVVEFVKADKFEVDQTASNGFNLLFGKAADVKIADVTVNKIIKVGDSTGKLPMVVNNVTMSEDKKTASVSLFSNFENGVTYEITVKGYEETVALVAAIGKPTTMSITSKSNMQGGILVYTNTPTDLVYTLYDEFGNDITNTTNGAGYVVYSVANATSSDYYVSGDSICIYKAGTEVAVNAEYFTGEMSADGYQITVKTTGYFVGADKAADSVAEVTLAIKRWGSNAYNGNKIPVSDDNLQLELKIKTTVWQDQLTPYLAGEDVEPLETATNPAPVVRLRSSNPDILDVRFDTDVVTDANGNPVVDEETGEEVTKRVDRVVLFKEGTAAILVDLITWNADGTENVNTIAATYVTVMPKRSISSITAEGVVTVGTETTYNTAYMNVTAKDQYGEGRDISSLAYVKLVDTGVDVTGAFTLLPRGTWNDWNNAKLEVSGDILELSGKDFAAGKNEITLYVIAKLVSNEWTVGYAENEVRFSVIVRRPAGAESLKVETSGDASGNVARYLTPYDGWNGTEKQKTVEFKVFTMQNGVKVFQEPVAKKTSNVVSGAAVNDLFYTVTHDGVDITANTYFDGNTVKLNYSGTESKYMAMPNGNGVYNNSVIYKTADNKALGAGNYVFTLYKVVADSTGTRLNYSYVSSASANVSCDMNGNYTLVKRTSETATHTSNGVTYTYNPNSQYGLYDCANQKALRDCFEINDTNGNKVDINAQTPYYVDAVDTEFFVHVKSITFYECVDATNNVYAPYTVNINVSLKK